MYIRTKDGVYENAHPYFTEDNKVYMRWDYPSNIEPEFLGDVISQSENLEELCDEFVFNSDVSSYVIDKKHIEHVKATILKIYKENDETDYVKAMHPKMYGAIWAEKGLIYVAKMNDKGELELI